MRKVLVIIVIIAAAAAGYYFFAMPKEPEVKMASYSPGEYFVTNVDKSNRLLKTSIVLVVNDSELVASFSENNFKIRDTIIFILRELTEEDIRTKNIENDIRERLREALNRQMETEAITDVWFNDFVMQ